MFESCQYYFTGHSRELKVISLINRRHIHHSVSRSIDTDRLYYMKLHSNENHHHNTNPNFKLNILCGELLISTALFTTLHVHKFDTTFQIKVKKHAATDFNYWEILRKIETGDYKTTPYTVTEELLCWNH